MRVIQIPLCHRAPSSCHPDRSGGTSLSSVFPSPDHPLHRKPHPPHQHPRLESRTRNRNIPGLLLRPVGAAPRTTQVAIHAKGLRYDAPVAKPVGLQAPGWGQLDRRGIVLLQETPLAKPEPRNREFDTELTIRLVLQNALHFHG